MGVATYQRGRCHSSLGIAGVKEGGAVCWTLFERPVTNEESSCVLSRAPFILASESATRDGADLT